MVMIHVPVNSQKAQKIYDSCPSKLHSQLDSWESVIGANLKLRGTCTYMYIHCKLPDKSVN